MKFALAIALCLIAITSCHAAVVCPVSSCTASETIWLNTTTMNAAIRGTTITFYPRQPNGNIYELVSTYLSIDTLGEITLDDQNTCETQFMYFPSEFVAASRMPRSINAQDSCCTSQRVFDVIEGDISRERVVINMTNPAYPDFYFEFVASTFNDTFIDPRPPTPDIGEGYNIEFLAQKIKIDVNVHNWPWITDEVPEAHYNDTFLQFFFSTLTQLDEVGRIRVFDSADAKILHYTASTSKALVEMDFLKVFTADGVDKFSMTNRLPPSLELDQNSEVMYFPAILSICQGNYSITPRYKHLSYDPNLNAIFLGDTPIATPANGGNKNKLHPAAYAVPIAAVGAVLIAGALYAFVIRPRRLANQSLVRRSAADL